MPKPLILNGMPGQRKQEPDRKMLFVTSDDRTVVVKQRGKERLRDGNLAVVQENHPDVLYWDGFDHSVIIIPGNVRQISFGLWLFDDQLLEPKREVGRIAEVEGFLDHDCLMISPKMLMLILCGFKLFNAEILRTL